jgi:hypothetical protein
MKETLDYLKWFQDWRTGKDEREMYEAGITPEKTTKVIDDIIKYLEKMEKENDNSI